MYLLRQPYGQYGDEAAYYRAAADCKTGNYIGCAGLLKAADERTSSVSFAQEIRYYKAWAYLKAGDTDSAGRAVKLVSDTERSKHKDSNYLMFLLAVRKNDAQDAVRYFYQLEDNSEFKQFAVLNLLKEKKLTDSNPQLSEAVHNTPVTLPYVALYRSFRLGNDKFIEKKYDEAEKIYVDALRLDTDAASARNIRFNLGQTYLKQKKYKDARRIFTDPETASAAGPHKARYHLFYALYHLSDFKGYPLKADSVPYESWSAQTALEAEIYKAAALVYEQKNTEAVNVLMQAYKIHKQAVLPEYAAGIAYYADNYADVLNIYKQASPKTEPLVVLYTASLLVQKKNTEALKEITPYKDSNSLKTRRIILRRGLQMRSTAMWLPIPRRGFPLVQMVAGEYIADRQDQSADRIYEAYEKVYDYRRPEVRMNRLHLLYAKQDWEKCSQKASEPLAGETTEDKINRVIIGTRCAANSGKSEVVITQVPPTLSDNKEYRAEERYLLLANAYQLKGDHKKALELLKNADTPDLSAEIQQEVRLARAESAAKTGNADEARTYNRQSRQLP
ncbi:hypothetical protein CHS0354_035288 [Potamilus streckersoni]|uniref:Tetratricopeptide repeat protein n=1 Tax=Potamilus streckersoni TaxID=2493646 RepID=A0AAE0VPB4_9BIVA|nr:hypothetical protein CHS0354_035288 [Potamilus streckersoni]